MTISTHYKTTEGTMWNTMQGAMLAEVFEQNALYLDSYKKRQIIELLVSNFSFTKIEESISQITD